MRAEHDRSGRNMFGDILSDAASVLPGSLGLMPLKRSRACFAKQGNMHTDVSGLTAKFKSANRDDQL